MQPGFSAQAPPAAQAMTSAPNVAAAAQFCDQVLSWPTVVFMPARDSDVAKTMFTGWSARTVTIPLATRAGNQVNPPALHAVIRVPKHDHFTIHVVTAHDGVCVAQASGHRAAAGHGQPVAWGGAPYGHVHHDSSNRRALLPCVSRDPVVVATGPSEALANAENMGNSRNLLLDVGYCLLCAGIPCCFVGSAQPTEFIVTNGAGQRIATHEIRGMKSQDTYHTQTSELRVEEGSTPEQRRLALMATLYHIAMTCSEKPGSSGP